jgi:hypothetical protein
VVGNDEDTHILGQEDTQYTTVNSHEFTLDEEKWTQIIDWVRQED